MKKIILLVSLLMISGLIFVSPVSASVWGIFGNRYKISGSSDAGALIYQFPWDVSYGGTVICTAQAPLPTVKGKDVSFQFTSEGMFWYGSSEGMYYLKASNNYRVTFILNNIVNTNKSGRNNIMFIIQGDSFDSFLMECDYRK